MEYYNGIRAIAAHDYHHKYADGLGKGAIEQEHYVSYGAYKKQLREGKLNLLRQGKGPGNYTLIDLASIPQKYRMQIIENSQLQLNQSAAINFDNYLTKDAEAYAFFTNYRYADGQAIATSKVDNITMWANGSSCLNAISKALQAHNEMRMRMGRKPHAMAVYKDAVKWLATSERVQAEFNNNLPTNYRTLKAKHELYSLKGYDAMIKRLKGNDNSKQISDEILNLLLDITALPNNPYATRVVEIYELFMDGLMELVDTETGELYNPADFLKNGKRVKVTVRALNYYLAQPKIQTILDRKRLGAKDFNDLHRPHRIRRAPNYALSKVSFDDRDLVFKARETKQRVKAYYAYDVLSGCRIGSSYSRDKNEQLFMDCLFDMFVFVERNGIGIPLEVEFEHHLVKQYEPYLQQIFPMVHFCAAGNSQEKRAEHFNRAVKYKIEKNNRKGVGRWWLKSRHNKIGVDKVNDEFKQTLKPFEQLVADDIADTMEWNNSPHPKYPGKTRMEVLLDNLNPNLPTLNKSHIYRYIGFETDTSVRRSQYVQVQGEMYMLPTPELLSRLGDNRRVKAYWMPNAEGDIAEVYLYQDGVYICECKKVVEYNEAQAERTEMDWLAKMEQDKYVAKFDKMVKDGVKERVKLEVVDKRKRRMEEVEEVEIVDAEFTEMPAVKVKEKSAADRALADMLGI